MVDSILNSPRKWAKVPANVDVVPGPSYSLLDLAFVEL